MTNALHSTLGIALFDGVQSFLAEARTLIMAAVLVIGAGMAIVAWFSRKSWTAALGACVATVLVVAVIATSPGLAEAAAEQVEKNTGAGSNDGIESIFGQ